MDEVQEALRRRRVAALLLRGLTTEEIVFQLQRQRVRDADGNFYSHDAVAADVEALHREWSAVIDVYTERGRVLAELREARRAAWSKSDFGAVYRGLQQEARLLGLNQDPQKPQRPRDFVDVAGEDRALLLGPDG